MKEFNVEYRKEFGVTVIAENEEEAVKKALKRDKWILIGDLHRNFLEVSEI